MFIALAACNANYDKAPSGLVYKISGDESGAKLEKAKFVKLNVEYSVMINGKDSILNTTYGKFPQFSAIDTTRSRVAYTYMELVPKSRVGETVEFSLSVDSLRGHNINLPQNIFHKGDFIKGKIQILNAYQTRDEIMADFKKEQAVEQAREGKMVEQYLAKNNITGAQKTKGGAYVLVESAGTGPKADTGKQAIVKYKGYLMDGGKVFDTNMDSSKGHAIPFPVNVGRHGVIPGWEEGLPYFGKGGKGKLFIPSVLGYGAQGQGEIPPNANLVFDIEILDVRDAPPPTLKPNTLQGLQHRKTITPAPPVKKAAH